MGLTAAQKKAVVNSWKTLAGDAKTMQNNGANLFGLLFNAHPDAFEQHFKHMAGMSNNLKITGVGRAHTMAVFNGIGAFVDCIDDDECMDGLAKKLARNHYERGVNHVRFGQMREVFGSFLDQAMGGSATTEVKTAWDAFIVWMKDYLAAEEKKH